MPINDGDEAIQTVFGKTPRLPTYLIAFTIFKQSLFSYVETKTNNNKTIVSPYKKNDPYFLADFFNKISF